jgi:hypothetical protein
MNIRYINIKYCVAIADIHLYYLGCEMLRILHCLDNRLIDGGRVVSPTNQPHFTPQKTLLFFCFRYSFLLEAE